MATAARAAADLKAFGIGVKRTRPLRPKGKGDQTTSHTLSDFWLLHLMIGKQHLFKINERCRFPVVESGPHSPDVPCSEQGCVVRRKKATLERSVGHSFPSLFLSVHCPN